MPFISEADVESLVLTRLGSLGYAVSSDAEIGPDGRSPEREAYADVVLAKRLVAAIERLNPFIPAEARGDALRKVLATERPSLVEENRRLPRTSKMPWANTPPRIGAKPASTKAKRLLC